MTISNAELEQAINATIAKEIISSLDSTHRNALLEKAMVKVLQSYAFEHVIGNVIKEKAMEVAATLIETQSWKTQIQDAITLRFQKYLVELQSAIHKTLLQAFHGKDSTDSYYREAGKILSNWPSKKDSTDKE